jgi:hypothetical protein
MDSFLHSRRQDSSVKEREHALQSLDLSYHKYKEVVRHLDDGMQVRIHIAPLRAYPLNSRSRSSTTI